MPEEIWIFIGNRVPSKNLSRWYGAYPTVYSNFKGRELNLEKSRDL